MCVSQMGSLRLTREPRFSLLLLLVIFQLVETRTSPNCPLFRVDQVKKVYEAMLDHLVARWDWMSLRNAQSFFTTHVDLHVTAAFMVCNEIKVLCCLTTSVNSFSASQAPELSCGHKGEFGSLPEDIRIGFCMRIPPSILHGSSVILVRLFACWNFFAYKNRIGFTWVYLSVLYRSSNK